MFLGKRPEHIVNNFKVSPQLLSALRTHWCPGQLIPCKFCYRLTFWSAQEIWAKPTHFCVIWPSMHKCIILLGGFGVKFSDVKVVFCVILFPFIFRGMHWAFGKCGKVIKNRKMKRGQIVIAQDGNWWVTLHCGELSNRFEMKGGKCSDGAGRHEWKLELDPSFCDWFVLVIWKFFFLSSRDGRWSFGVGDVLGVLSQFGSHWGEGWKRGSFPTWRSQESMFHARSWSLWSFADGLSRRVPEGGIAESVKSSLVSEGGLIGTYPWF